MFQKDAHSQLEAQHGLTGLRGKIDFTAQDPMVRFNIEQIESAVLTGLTSGVLRREQLQGGVVDFGCGRGVSTALLSSYGGSVTGVEIDAKSVEQGKKLSFVPAEQIVTSNGIDYLRSLPAGSLDVVSASMLGPDIEGTFCRQFLQACEHALKPGGTVLVTSEVGTLSTLQRVNPLGNGFTQNGVFLAVRGMADDRSFDTFGSFSLGISKKTDFRALSRDLDLSALLKQLNLEG